MKNLKEEKSVATCLLGNTIFLMMIMEKKKHH